jgi:hypothetical protein
VQIIIDLTEEEFDRLEEVAGDEEIQVVAHDLLVSAIEAELNPEGETVQNRVLSRQRKRASARHAFDVGFERAMTAQARHGTPRNY